MCLLCFIRFHLNESESTIVLKVTNGMKVKVSDSLDNVPNENVVTHLGTDRPTDQLTDQLLELLEWLFATKNILQSYLGGWQS